MKLLRWLSAPLLLAALLGIVASVSERTQAQQAQKTVARAVNSDQVLALAFSPDGRMVAGGGCAKEIAIWDVETGKLQRRLVGHSRMVRAVAFAPRGQILASGGDDQTIRLWDAGSGDLKQTISGFAADEHVHSLTSHLTAKHS